MAAVIVIVMVIAALVLLGPVLHLAVGLVGLIIPVLLWMVAGMLAGRLLRGRGYGPVGDVVLGLVGGIVGSIILGALGLGGIGQLWLVGNVVVGVVGAVLLVWGIRFVGNSNFAR
ncbi:MAG: GlsB/YeaQ/YmgE family stress response membrane protein [Anaerolineae bacterium]|nr:GlsB/YeaQ/YmgE family stress response membrane protein [Anaerolineae bacterium]